MNIYVVVRWLPSRKKGSVNRVQSLYAANHIRDVIKELRSDLNDSATEIEELRLLGPLVKTLPSEEQPRKPLPFL